MPLPITWSVMIPTYNSAQYLAETLKSVMAELQESMEVVVVDNCSTDNTKQIVDEVGKGRIIWFQNPVNIGMMNNFNKCIEVANGQLLHILNSDDVVNPGYYKAMETAFAENPDVYLVSCDCQIINEQSVITSASEKIESLTVPSNVVDEFLVQNKFRTPGVTVRKEAYKIVGGFDPELIQTADWDMWLRVIFNFKGLHLNKSLCKYREHSNNGSSRVMLTGENILDTERLYKKFDKLGYPVDKRKQIDFLSEVSKGQYIYFYYMDNSVGMENMINIYKQVAGKRNAVRLKIFVKWTSVKRKIKKIVSR